MKKYTLPAVAALLIFSVLSCRKNLDSTVANPGPGIDSSAAVVSPDTTKGIVYFPQHSSNNCASSPFYGDTVLYAQPNSTDYIVMPVNVTDSGKYYAWPNGLALDHNTGAINISKSETGVRYNIGFIKKGGIDTCLQTLIVAGASYVDSVYVINDGERFAVPYFNADPSLKSVCSGGGPGSNACKFDITDKLAKHLISIDKQTGIIDLKNTMSRAFGPFPINGSVAKVTMDYTLNDKSKSAPQQITLQFMYYDKKSNIPPALLAAIDDKLNKALGGMLMIDVVGSGPLSMYSNPRPPIIVVTRFAL